MTDTMRETLARAVVVRRYGQAVADVLWRHWQDRGKPSEGHDVAEAFRDVDAVLAEMDRLESRPKGPGMSF